MHAMIDASRSAPLSGPEPVPAPQRRPAASDVAARATGTTIASIRPGRANEGTDRAGTWLRNAMAALAVLAVAAAVVSWTAQYRMDGNDGNA